MSKKFNIVKRKWPPKRMSYTRTRMANSALKCRIIISIAARSLCNYNNILINFGHVYSMWISSTLGSEVLYLSHISEPHKMTYFLAELAIMYGIWCHISQSRNRSPPYVSTEVVNGHRRWNEGYIAFVELCKESTVPKAPHMHTKR